MSSIDSNMIPKQSNSRKPGKNKVGGNVPTVQNSKDAPEAEQSRRPEVEPATEPSEMSLTSGEAAPGPSPTIDVPGQQGLRPCTCLDFDRISCLLAGKVN
jgi:hypothetical protein